MKHLIRLVLVVALLAGVACADSVVLEPNGPYGMLTPADIGTQVTLSLVWYHDTALQYAVGFDFLIGIDVSELAVVVPPDPPGPAGPSYHGDMGSVSFAVEGDNMRVWNLQADYYEASSSPTVLVNDFVVEIIALGPQDGDDAWVMDQVDNEGMALYLEPDYAEIGIVKYGPGAGPDMYGVPEPTTTALLGIGLLGALLRKRS